MGQDSTDGAGHQLVDSPVLLADPPAALILGDLPPDLDGVRRYAAGEVDNPDTGRWKQERLTRAGVTIPPHVTYAAIDFERETLSDALGRGGFDSKSRRSSLGLASPSTSHVTPLPQHSAPLPH